MKPCEILDAAALVLTLAVLAGCRASASAPVELSECRADADCLDVSACNGEEQCMSGVCESGEPRECPAEMTCRDRKQEASCEFLPKSPWLLYANNSDANPESFGLSGLPTAHIGKLEPFELSPALATGEYWGPANFDWSPNGKRLLLNMMRRDLTGRMYWLEFGAGMPTDVRAVGNIPVVAEWFVTSWSVDAQRALLLDVISDEVYELDFSVGDPRPSRLEGISDAAYCADAVVFKRGGSDDLYLAHEFSDTEPELLGTREYYLSDILAFSPDGKYVRVDDSQSGGVWVDCTPHARHSFLALDAVAWSSDGKYMAIASDDWTSVVSTEDGLELWSAPKEDSFRQAWWAEDGNRLVVEDELETGERAWRSVDPPSGEVLTGVLPSDAKSVRAWGSNVLFVRGEPYTLDMPLWLSRPNSDPVWLGGCNSEYSVDVSPDGRSLVCVLYDELSGSRVIAFDLELETSTVGRDLLPEALAGSLSLEGFSPDGRGFLVSRHVTAEAKFVDALWFPSVPYPTGPPIKLNRGNYAELNAGDLWQPFP